MRIVSWFIVATSLVALTYRFLDPFLDRVAIPAEAMEQMAGTVISAGAGGSPQSLHEFAESYTRAWNSGNARRVAGFFTDDASLVINDAEPATGTEAITRVVQGFMAEFPDLEVTMRDLEARNGRLVYHWTLSGTSLSGKRVKINGTETWTLDTDDGLIADSRGRYDAHEFARQLAGSN